HRQLGEAEGDAEPAERAGRDPHRPARARREDAREGMLESLLVVHGFMTTLMQPSSLSRKVLYMAGPSSSGTLCVMTNDGSIWPSAMRCSRSSVQRLTCVCPVRIVSALFMTAPIGI